MDLPIKKAVFDENNKNLGLQLVSFVSDPAIQVTWLKFSKENPVKLSIQSEEKRIIFTPVLIPNQKIYRNIGGEEFDLVFDEQTIEKIAMQWMRDNLSDQIDENHSQKLIEGVRFYESFILSDRASSVNPAYEKLPKGTWFLTGKVENDETWAKIKAQELNGVSIDGFFKTMNVQARNNFKLTEVKVANDNSLFIDGEIAVGSMVYYNRPSYVLINGVKSEMKNLVWENQISLEDGTVLELAEGKITEIKTKVSASADRADKEIQEFLDIFLSK